MQSSCSFVDDAASGHSAGGLGPRASFGLSGTERRALGLCNRKEDLYWQRVRWERVANEALAAAGFTARIYHRAPPGKVRAHEPPLRLPLQIYKIEQETGRPSRVGEALRQQHRERVEARSKGPDELARVVRRQKREARRAVLEREALEASLPKKISRAVLNRAELNQLQREWRQAQKVRARVIEASLSVEQRGVQSGLEWRGRNPVAGQGHNVLRARGPVTSMEPVVERGTPTPASGMTAAERLRQRAHEVAERLAVEREGERVAHRRLEAEKAHELNRNALKQERAKQKALDRDYEPGL